MFRYVLDPGSTKFTCPNCEKRTLVRYIDTDTKLYLEGNFGRCDREDNCGYFVKPEKDMQRDKQQSTFQKPKFTKPPEKPVSYIPAKLCEKSLQEYEQNKFIQYLSRIFPSEVVSNLIAKYFIGTSKHRFTNTEHHGYKSEPGAVVFWQIDIHGKIRSGKIMLYNPETGKRIKQPFPHTTWAHKFIKQPDFNLKQCFFGEHLLKGNTLPVAIVESEKTAIVASAYLPQFIWIAAGAKNGLQADKCKVLLGRNVTLWPDCKAFTNWEEQSKSIPADSVKVSRLIEDRATPEQKEQGYDLADYLTMIDFRTFIQPSNSEPEPQPANEPESEPEPQPEVNTVIQPVQQKKADRQLFPNSSTTLAQLLHKPEPEKVGDWTNEISELETFFSGITLPQPPIRLNSYTTITNPQLFVENHFSTIRAQAGKQTFKPYLNRLHELTTNLTNLTNLTNK